MLSKKIQPKFYFGIYFLRRAFGVVLFISVASYCLIGLIKGWNTDPSDTEKALFIYYAVVSACFLFWVGFAFLERENWKGYSYEFLEDRVVFRGSYLTNIYKELKYSDIKEVLWHQGFLQKKYGLGNVKLLTGAISNGTGLTLNDIQNVEEIYAFFRYKMEKACTP